VKSYSRSHLSDGTLLSNLAARVSQERSTTADMLADIAEVEERRLYAPAGYSSMYAYCLEALNFSEDSACKRIRAARVARQFPAIFPAVADGRLHLSGVVLLAPHLTAEHADELLAAASHQSKSQIERLLAERSPRPDVPASIQPLSPSPVVQPLAGMGELSAPGRIDGSSAAKDCPARAPALCAAAHDRPERLRQAALRTRAARPSDPVGRSGRDLRAPAGSGHSPAREAQIRGVQEAAVPPEFNPERRKAYSCARSARRLGARRRSVHVRERYRPSLLDSHPARVRSCSGDRAWRGVNSRQPPAPVPDT